VPLPKAPKRKRKGPDLTPPEFPGWAHLAFNDFKKAIDKAAKSAKIKLPPAHAFRIGGTTEYLLRNVPFKAVKRMGRWAGDSFKLYLRKHAEIMAPFLVMHDNGLTHLTRVCIELPPVC
jgi:hypothetical protein